MMVFPNVASSASAFRSDNRSALGVERTVSEQQTDSPLRIGERQFGGQSDRLPRLNPALWLGAHEGGDADGAPGGYQHAQRDTQNCDCQVRQPPNVTRLCHLPDVHRNSFGATSFRYRRQLCHSWPPGVSMVSMFFTPMLRNFSITIRPLARAMSVSPQPHQNIFNRRS